MRTKKWLAAVLCMVLALPLVVTDFVAQLTPLWKLASLALLAGGSLLGWSELRRVRRETAGTFQFKPRWKEELVVSGPGGRFVLELPMGVLSAYLPTEEEWRSRAPDWAKDLWPVLRDELERWCRDNHAALHIEASAAIRPA